MSDISIRPATMADAEAICAIYNQGIEDRIATLETELRTPEERRQWLGARGTRHPVIVAEAGGRTVGWECLNPFNPRRAYDHVADLSVYVERGWRGRGVGRRLLERLVALAREIGYHKMVLAALPFNRAGVALYQRLGSRAWGSIASRGRWTAAGWTSSLWRGCCSVSTRGKRSLFLGVYAVGGAPRVPPARTPRAGDKLPPLRQEDGAAA